MEFYSKQDHPRIIPSKFNTFLDSGRVRRPQRLPAATVTPTQYPERYVVSRDPQHNFWRPLELAADLADAPKIDRKVRILSGLWPVQFL